MSYPVIKNFLFLKYNFEFIFQSITLLTINLHFCLYFLWFLVNISLPVAYTISGCTRSLVRPTVPENGMYIYIVPSGLQQYSRITVSSLNPEIR